MNLKEIYIQDIDYQNKLKELHHKADIHPFIKMITSFLNVTNKFFNIEFDGFSMRDEKYCIYYKWYIGCGEYYYYYFKFQENSLIDIETFIKDFKNSDYYTDNREDLIEEKWIKILKNYYKGNYNENNDEKTNLFNYSK